LMWRLGRVRLDPGLVSARYARGYRQVLVTTLAMGR